MAEIGSKMKLRLGRRSKVKLKIIIMVPINSVTTDHGTWIHDYKVPIKVQNKIWIYDDEDTPVSVMMCNYI